MSVDLTPQTLTPRQSPAKSVRRWNKGAPAGVSHTRLYRTFWLFAIGFIILLCVKGYGVSPSIWLGAVLIAVAALLPSYLWVSRKVLGLPIFPLYALTATWIYSLPLVYEHPMILLFPPSFQLTAALSVTGFLLLATAVWYLVARRPIKPVTTCWMLDDTNCSQILVVVFGINFLLMVAIGAGWLNSGQRIFSVLRAVLLATQALVCFVLSYKSSQGKLQLELRWAFYALLAGTLLVSITSLLLINAMSLLGLAVLAHVIGARKMPVFVCAGALFVFGFLHDGKALMRERYWHDSEDDMLTLSPLQYPGFFAEWVQTSWRVITVGDEEPPEPLAQRASLMHLLLYFQSATPNYLPFLYGESYKVIPVLFVPRMFYPDKPRSLEGSYIITVYYGIQTREDTEITAVDVGLINEAYANFGYFGMAGLAVVLGSFFGFVSNWARQMPILSFRALFGFLILGSILQASSSAGFYIASLFQASAVLFALAVPLLRMRRPDRRRNSFLE